MRFEEQPHWNDGQFLQPHHFQYLQRLNSESFSINRRFSLPYPWGLLEMDVDKEALSGARVVLHSFSAFLPSGTALSQPGNCIVAPLDLRPALAKHPASLVVSLALPQWSEFEANLADESGDEHRLFRLDKKRLRDENSGDNEITLLVRGLCARLVTNLDDVRDWELLPIMRLRLSSQVAGNVSVAIDETFCPPYAVFSAGNPLWNMLSNLTIDLGRCRDNLLANGPSLTLMAVQRGAARMQALLRAAGECACFTPFDFYLELLSLLSELEAAKLDNSVGETQPYTHEDCRPCFVELVAGIRSFITSEGSVAYSRIDCALTEDGLYLQAALGTEELLKAGSIFLAVACDAPQQRVIEEVEAGDTFRLMSPESVRLRARGIRMHAERYPPRFLPVLAGYLWFRLGIEESARIWREICEARRLFIDWGRELFPALKASLFVTLVERGR
jgi:type VI secretion system protein ImpJ